MIEQCHVLILDDEKNYLLVLQAMLEDAGYKTTALNDPETALPFLEESEVDVIITDMKMPRLTGQDILEHVKKDYPHIPVLIMTAFGSIEGAVEAMRCGAFDYITKPFSNDELLLAVQNASLLAKAHRRYRLLQENLENRFGLDQIVGNSKATSDMLAMVSRAAPAKSTVLIYGESGTGKEMIARSIHFASPRAKAPFISVNCMALNPGVLESELFGHEKGSFTGAERRREGRFAQAHGGTLFLDEVGEMPLSIQAKLLRALQQGEVQRVGSDTQLMVDVRVLAATNRDLRLEVAQKRFREDLFFRLNVISVDVPPLRERAEDVPLLAAHFLEEFASRNRKAVRGFSAQALDTMLRYSWPGNVRELENAVERAVILCHGDLITGRELPSMLFSEAQVEERPADLDASLAGLPLDEVERRAIEETLRLAGDNKSEAARRLGTTRATLHNKLRKYGLE